MGPWATPLIIRLHDPQIPSRQSWSKAIGTSPRCISRSLTTSSISRKDISGLISAAWYSTKRPGAEGLGWRQMRKVRFTVCSWSGDGSPEERASSSPPGRKYPDSCLPAPDSLVAPLRQMYVLELQRLLVQLGLT